ncbi:V-set and immunoglobulin domain-containing protein 10 isoform X3 [Eublepharis macularius]|uniref:V-set and immunoglobulin domain-containing protein 10 isoform X3 n=1 Tax=Eublepharis macularius TaxID=481883 RepID=UPI00240FF9AD|nr:V-set and immunoglobulin domain-containing protein 10 isoform X3 [Eublepharis macularius]
MARSLFAGLCVFALCVFKGDAGTETLVIGIAGKDVTLMCQNASEQALVVEWFRGDPSTTPILFSSDGEVPDDARFSLVGNTSLHISELRLQDESNYTCKEVLNETAHLHRVQLLVANPPPALPQCWVQTSNESTRGVQLFCQWPGGYPHPTLHWRDKEDLSGREINTTSLADSVVATLNSSQLLHEKEFMCHGRHVLVQEAKAACTVQLTNPLVTSDPVRSCFVGKAVALTCQSIAGNPRARITWLRNISQPEREIRSSGRFRISQEGNTSTLIIQNCSRSTDEGYYVCKAENSVGLREMYIHLTVNEPVNVGGIVGTIVVLLLLGILVFFGVFLYAGPRLCPKGTLLRTRDSSDILVLMDSEDEDVPTEAPGDPAWHRAMVRANGHATRTTESSHAEKPSEFDLEEKEPRTTT